MAAGYKDFTAGAVLTAADLEDYTQNQSIMRFASASARDTALSTVKTEGMHAYLIDVNWRELRHAFGDHPMFRNAEPLLL